MLKEENISENLYSACAVRSLHLLLLMLLVEMVLHQQLLDGCCIKTKKLLKQEGVRVPPSSLALSSPLLPTITFVSPLVLSSGNQTRFPKQDRALLILQETTHLTPFLFYTL